MTTTLVIDSAASTARGQLQNKTKLSSKNPSRGKNIDGFSNRQQQLNSLHEANSTQFTSHEKTNY